MKANYSIPTNGLQIQALLKQVALILRIIDETFAVPLQGGAESWTYWATI